MEKIYSVGTKSTRPNGDDIWDTKRIDEETAIMILVHNGWTEEEAKKDLAECPDKWIPVNSCTTLC